MKEEENKEQDIKDIHIHLLKESLWDVRDQRNFFKKLMLVLCGIIVVQICAMLCLGIYDRHILKESYPSIENVNTTHED